MRHLYNSRAEILRLAGVLVDGTPTLTWARVDQVADAVWAMPGELMCRIDLTFVRPGKDQPMPVVAGRAPDRVGLMLFDPTDVIRSGDRIRTLSGPIVGTFEVRAVPDPAVGRAHAHHMEVQIMEVAQDLPGALPQTPQDTP